jgi:hypothetical protein
MADITVQAFGGQITPLGTTSIGKEQAAAAIAGVEDLKTYTAGGQTGQVSGVSLFRAPKGSNLSGQISLPSTQDVVQKLKFIIDTTDNTDAVNIVMFDNLKLHSNDCMAGCPGGGGGASTLEQTRIYFEKVGNECGYEAFINEICSRTYVVTSLRFKPQSRVSGVLPQTSIPITVSHKNIKGKVTGEDSFNTDDHESPTQQRDIFITPLMGETQVLGKYTAWILENVEPGHIFTLEMTVGVAGLHY